MERSGTVSFAEAARFWVKLGFINFGGPAGQIAIMHEELVERRRWISDDRFFHALNYCMLLPGPEAQQLSVYIGWLLHRVRGGIVAGVAFILPAFFLILGLSWVFVAHGDVTWVSAVFYGLRAAVLGIVAAALVRVARGALRSWAMYAIAAGAFVSLFVLHVPFPLVIGAALLLGLLAGPRWPVLFPSGELAEEDGSLADVDPGGGVWRNVRTLLIGLAVWLGPLLVVTALRGGGDVLTDEAWFFSRAALVTFGGAYAVLAYINQAAVQQYGWLLPGQMVTGLGLAESTPGPLIMVTEFVGFVAAYRNPGGLDPLAAGVLGAIVTTWATFAPCFLFIFLGAPYVERLRRRPRLRAALATITAAVVGVILNLAVWFGLHTLFTHVQEVRILGGPFPVPDPGTIDIAALVIGVGAFLAMWKLRWHVVTVVGLSALVGLLVRFLG